MWEEDQLLKNPRTLGKGFLLERKLGAYLNAD